MDTIHEETLPSRPNFGMTINVGFFPTVPGVFSYGSPSYAISSSEYSQAEHENVRIADLEHDRRLMDLGFSHALHYFTDGFLEDRIIIECLDNTNIACQPHVPEKPSMARLYMARSHLMHSRWFVKWFSSPYYLSRAGMKVTWHRDPIACWEMAKYYMEDGYDQFGNNQIASHVCTRFRLADRFIVLVRLYKLARILELFGLMDRALAVLKQTEHLVSPANVITLTRYIFGGEDYCENISQLRKWCLKLVSKHYDWLARSDQWGTVVKDAVPDLEEQWIRITASNRAVPHEEVRRLSQQNLRDAKAFIDSVTVVHCRSDGSMQQESVDAIDAHLVPATSRKENSLAISWRDGTESPTKKLKAKKSVADLTILQQIQSLRENIVGEGNLNDENTQAAFPNRNSSVRTALEGQEGVTMKTGKDLKLPAPRLTLSQKSSFQENFDIDTNRSFTDTQGEEIQSDGFVGQMNDSFRTPMPGILSTSFSEPLLTSRQFGDISNHAEGSSVDRLEGMTELTRLSSDTAIANIQKQGVAHHQRGVVVTLGPVSEPDSWALADIPLPDPLLPLARQAPSLDFGATVRDHFSVSTHHAQAVTIFGIHRPGMGGSIITIDENAAPKESQKRAPNQAKAREFLGIDTPAPVGVTGPKSRSPGDVEGRKLKKKNQWLGRHGE